ncbi:MAG TPA: hypothetical protein VKB56_01910 [Terriglobales bacterium]|nr:hypothetical protein [Terriglobales bacterium]
MKPFVLIAVLIAIVLFIAQSFIRRAMTRASVAGVRQEFDEIAQFEVGDVTGTIEGRRHGQRAGMLFVKSTTRSKPDAKSSIEFWCECRVRVPFRAQGRPGALFNRDFEFTSSQPQQLEALKSGAEFSSAMQDLAEAGAESVYAARDRLVVTFRPYQPRLMKGQEAQRIFDLLERAARDDES